MTRERKTNKHHQQFDVGISNSTIQLMNELCALYCLWLIETCFCCSRIHHHKMVYGWNFTISMINLMLIRSPCENEWLEMFVNQYVNICNRNNVFHLNAMGIWFFCNDPSTNWLIFHLFFFLTVVIVWDFIDNYWKPNIVPHRIARVYSTKPRKYTIEFLFIICECILLHHSSLQNSSDYTEK